MVDFQKLGEWLNKCVNERMIIRVGRYDGNYYVGNEEFTRIQGEFFIKTNSDTIFRVVSDDSSIVDDFDVIDSDAIITPLSESIEHTQITYDEVDISNKASLRAYFPKDEIGIEMFECTQSVPIRFRKDALDLFDEPFDREKWTWKSVNKSWSYFLEDILQEMTDEEKRTYGF